MKNLAWFLGGLLAGATAALLLAPATGKDTRSKIRELVMEKFPNMTKREVEKFVDQVMNRVSDENIEADVEED